MSKFSWVSSLLFFCLCFTVEKGESFTISFPHSEEKAFVLVHEDSVATYHQLLSCIDHAQRYIELCPCMTGGKILQEILEHIDQRMEAVTVLQTYMIIQPTVIDKDDSSRLSYMQNKWGDRFQYIFTDCPPHTNFLSPNVVELHSKMSVIDGKYIIMGGTNFEDFMCTRGDSVPEPSNSSRLVIGGVQRPLALRDQDVTICSEDLGLAMRREFHAHYAMWQTYKNSFWFNKYLKDFRGLGPINLTKEEISGICNDALENNSNLIPVDLKNIRIIFSGPDERDNAITEEYATLIDQAKERVYISNMYFLPMSKIFQSLMRATWERNIHLDVITNGCSETSPSITSFYAWGNRMNYFPLCFGDRPSFWKKNAYITKQPNSLLTIREFNVPDTELHKKCMLIDDHTFVIGSYNLGKKSDECDYESIVVIQSPEVVQAIEQIVMTDEALSVLVPHEQIYQWYFHPLHHFVGHLEINFMPA